jgi:hypothetical protein
MEAPHMTQSPKPIALSGAYYWIPARVDQAIAWRLKTCHDFGVWDGISHREFWPHVLEHLAGVWGRDDGVLKHLLEDHYTGLPRGRVTHPKGRYVIIHGNDAPANNWKAAIKARFGLRGLGVKTIFDEHERMLHEDARAFEEAFDVQLDLPCV